MLFIKLLTILLMVSFIGCTGAPVIHPMYLDLKNGICYKYPDYDPAKACSTNVGKSVAYPLSECEGMFGVTPQDVANLNAYKKAQCANQPK